MASRKIEDGFTAIYSLSEPDTEMVRYIGKSNNPHERYNTHLKKAGNNSSENNKRTCWIKSLNFRGLKPIMEVIDIVPLSEWQTHEREYIKLFKSIGAKLVNGTDGGDNGVCFTQDVRRKMSAAQIGKKLSDKTKEKISIAGKGRIFSEERNRKISLKNSGLKRSEETKKRISKTQSYRGIIQFDKNMNFIKEWQNSKQIQNEMGFPQCNVCRCCRGKRKTASGFIWRYKNNDR